jgi:CBS domain containing-hemolysin-like protein
MPDSDPLHSGPTSSTSSSEPAVTRNLPVPVPVQPSAAARGNGEGWFARVLRVIFGLKPSTIRADLKDVLATPEGETGFSPTERRMLSNILGLRERRISDVMVPRADIIAVQRDIGIGELMKVFESAGHSRLVVYDDTLDDAVGMVHIRDLVAFMTVRAAASAKANTRRKKPFPAGLDLKAIDLSMPLSGAQIIREILYAPPSMPVLDLLAKMQTTRIHLALVVDEYGGSDGVVSIEDIVEQIVGEIADEHDEETTPGVVRQADGSFVADARAGLDDVTAIVGGEFDVGEVAQEVDTLAGYVATRIGRVPVRGELVPGPGPFELEILDADPRRVKKLRIYRGLDRQNGRLHEPRRQALTGTGATPPGTSLPGTSLAGTNPPGTSATPNAPASTPAPSPSQPPPPAGDESAQLSPDAAPSNSVRRP